MNCIDAIIDLCKTVKFLICVRAVAPIMEWRGDILHDQEES